jgi:hypothetical protein
MVLADNGVPESLTGTSHAHSEGQEGESSHAGGVAADNGFVDTDTGEVVDIAGLGQTDNGVDQDVGLARTSSTDSQLTMGTVHGVTSLEGNNTGPVQLLEVGADLCRGVSVGDIVVVDRGLNGLNVSSDVEFLDGLVEVLDRGVSNIVVTKDLNGLFDLVGSVDVLNSQDGDGIVVTGIAKSNALVGLQRKAIDIFLRDIQVDWDRPEGSVGKTEIIDNTEVVLLVQETLKRRETSRDDELKIAKLTLGEDDGLEGLGLLEELLVDGLIAGNKILEDSAVRSVGHCGICGVG